MEVFFPRRKKSGNPVVYIHPVTGEYEIPMNPDVPIPLRYAVRGFIKKEFTSYHEHTSWMKQVGLVNHATEDVRNDGDIIKRSEDKDSLGN